MQGKTPESLESIKWKPNISACLAWQNEGWEEPTILVYAYYKGGGERGEDSTYPTPACEEVRKISASNTQVCISGILTRYLAWQQS